MKTEEERVRIDMKRPRLAAFIWREVVKILLVMEEARRSLLRLAGCFGWSRYTARPALCLTGEKQI
jgi:hypothetical protein